jgi:hypothetical protein
MKPRLAGLMFVPGLLSGAGIIWGGTKVFASSILLAVLMIAIGVVTIVLVLRMMVENRAAADRLESTGALTTPHFDYLIWTALVVPMVLVVALLILGITSALANR